MHAIRSLVSSGDIALFYLLNCRVKCRTLDKIMLAITHLGDAAFAIGFTGMLLVFGGEGLRFAGREVLAALTLSHVVVYFLKRLVNRPRPHLTLKGTNTFDVPICAYSFPSGHTNAAFAIAMILALHYPAVAAVPLMVAALVGLSRTYLGVHYPSDVLVGALIGSLNAFAVHYILT